MKNVDEKTEKIVKKVNFLYFAAKKAGKRQVFNHEEHEVARSFLIDLVILSNLSLWPLHPLWQEKSVLIRVHLRLISIFLMFFRTTYDIRYAQYERSHGLFLKISLIFEVNLSIIPNKIKYRIQNTGDRT